MKWGCTVALVVLSFIEGQLPNYWQSCVQLFMGEYDLGAYDLNPSVLTAEVLTILFTEAHEWGCMAKGCFLDLFLWNYTSLMALITVLIGNTSCVSIFRKLSLMKLFVECLSFLLGATLNVAYNWYLNLYVLTVRCTFKTESYNY